MQNKNKLKFDLKKCISCGTCIAICSKNAIKFKNNKPSLNIKICELCGTCVQSCPVQAIALDKK